MPLYMDTHKRVPGLTAEAVAGAHAKDLEVQANHVGLLDTTVEALRPEAMVYRPGPNGQLQLGAVEYVVPAAAWDAEGHGHLPQVLGQTIHLNEALGVYILHAWVWINNPAGLFEDWNPTVTCSG